MLHKKKMIQYSLVVLVLILLGGSYGLYQFNKKVESLEHSKPNFIVTANELYNDFEADEKFAMEKYSGEIVQVNGEILSVNRDDKQNNIILRAENALIGGVNCSIREPIGALKAGDNITIRGKCQGFLMDVIINNGYVVEE